MKRCPECGRDYFDDTLLYCLDDGNALLEGPASGDAKTQTLNQADMPREAATKPLLVDTGEKLTLKSGSSSENIVAEIKRHKTGTAIVSIILLVVIAGFVYGLYSLLKNQGGQSQTASKPAAASNMKALTASGNIREAAISPDGKFLAYTENTDTGTGLWTKQIATNSNVPIAPMTIYDYFALQFSPDGEYVYYGQFEQGSGTIYRVSTLGSTRTRIVSDVEGQISFSPDGKQFVVERYNRTSSESDLMIVNSDGSGERKLASRSGHQYFGPASPSWSPDGKMIACSLGDDTIEHEQTIGVVNVADGSINTLGKARFDVIAHTVWQRDQSGILLIASDKGANVPHQIWEVSYTAGEARQLTHNLTGYVLLSMTADGKTLVAVQRDSFGSVWFSPSGDINKAELISKGKHEGNEGMTLMPDGRVVYVSTISGATEIWTMNADGSSPKQLTNDGLSKYTPTVTSDGRFIVYIPEKAGRHLWRMNADGSQPIQLTDTDGSNPRTSPDGNWVIYDSYRSGKQLVWRIPIEGGEPVQVTDFAATEPDVSPDGKYIACFFVDEQADKKWRIAVVPFEGGNPVKTFDLPQTVAVDNSPMWTPDGKGITYIDWVGSASNLWVQPFDGGPPKQLTNYKQGYIFRREWTKGGKQVAIVRGTETSDAVMITDFK